MKLLIKKIVEDAIIPTYGSKYAAGLDIYSYENYTVKANTRRVIPTGISLEWEGEDCENYYLRIAPRSGLSVKKSIDIGAGVIDYDYRGEIMVCFINNSDSDYTINKGDRIAQAILEKNNRFNEIIEVDELGITSRNNNGFGSTGK